MIRLEEVVSGIAAHPCSDDDMFAQVKESSAAWQSRLTFRLRRRLLSEPDIDEAADMDQEWRPRTDEG